MLSIQNYLLWDSNSNAPINASEVEVPKKYSSTTSTPNTTNATSSAAMDPELKAYYEATATSMPHLLIVFCLHKTFQSQNKERNLLFLKLIVNQSILMYAFFLFSLCVVYIHLLLLLIYTGLNTSRKW